MPLDDGDIHLLAKLVEALELIVDERLQRADIQDGETRITAVRNLREDWQKCRFRLASGGGRCDHDIAIATNNGKNGAGLNLTKLIPALVAYPAADGRMELMVGPFKRVGGW
ncbi:hypothetical protein ES707_15244 [subsurface metagenome]